jgi:gliding motility-associated-like protein
VAVFKIDFQVNCQPLITSASICYGSVATVSLMNINNLGSPSYSIQPGGQVSSNPAFTVSPASTSVYTLFITGVNAQNAVVTQSGLATVSVTPQPTVTSVVTQPTCYNPANAFSLNVSFLPSSSSLSYSINWSAIPFGVTSNTQTSSSGGIVPGPYAATVTASNGCFAVSQFTVNTTPTPLQFNVQGPSTITCAQPSTTLQVVPSSNSYTWSGPTGVFTGTSAVFTATNAGSWTISGVSAVSGCANTNTFNLGTNITVSTSTITPLTQVINCSLTSVTQVSAAGTPTVNFTHYWLTPAGTTLTGQVALGTFSPGGPGTYTHILVNDENGCSVTKTFTVTSSSGYPTFSVTSPQNFSLGCSTKSVITINIVNAQSTPAGAPVSYTIMSPSSNARYTTNSQSSYTALTQPGTYTIITRDDNNLCETKVQQTVLQNTFAPNIGVTAPRTILTCDEPGVVLQGTSTNTFVAFNWSFPGVPGNLFSDTIHVRTTTNVTNSLVANFTLTVTDKNNSCTSNSVVPVLQNISPPKVNFSGATPISCKVPTITLTNISVTGIPPFFNPVLPVIGYLWKGPSPQEPKQLSTTYVGYTPGTYTLTGKDLNNGCTASVTHTVDDLRDYPIVNLPDAPEPFIFDCAASGATIAPIITSPTNALTYSWMAVPNTSFSTFSEKTTIVNNIGTYNILVTNTISGCISSGVVEVILGKLEAKFTADPSKGFAPHNVTFTNLSASSSTTSGRQNITSNWSFGNGQSLGPVQATINPAMVYRQAGTYTVVLFVNKGACSDTAVQLIHVEIPSALEIPNVFTPNNDGKNDLFFLKATNLSAISATIHDRWGHLVYELSSGTGNILWDGKNQYGQEVAEGVYFYVIKASGTDGKEYEEQGTLTLLR